MRTQIALSALLLAMPLAADGSERDTFGVQVRGSLPGGNIPDATGNQSVGLGASFLAELHFESEVCARVLMGADSWRQKGGSGDRSVKAYHLGVEAVYFLRDEGNVQMGPYLVGGVAGVTWALGADARADGKPLRVIHLGLTAGFGYRLNRYLDVELKALTGKVDVAFTGTATTLGVTYRF